MSVWLRLVALIIVVVAPFTQALAKPSCTNKALSLLQQHDQPGYQVYLGVASKNDFLKFLNCSASDLDIYTAIHEGVHAWDFEQSVYHLDSGANIPMAKDVRIAPRVIYSEVSKNPYASTYINGDASSSDSFSILLDEANAYSRELMSASRLVKFLNPNSGMGSSNRDGVASMMLFIKIYLNRVKQSAEWNKLISYPETVNAVREIWAQSELSLKLTCQYDSLGIDDAGVIKQVYSASKREGIVGILGAVPQVPVECAKSFARRR